MPKMDVSEILSFAGGSGGSNLISLYSGVGTETMTLRHLYVPLAEVTMVWSPDCWILNTGDLRTTDSAGSRLASPLENDCVPTEHMSLARIFRIFHGWLTLLDAKVLASVFSIGAHLHETSATLAVVQEVQGTEFG